jgi:PPM family protein phosphatase
VRITAAAATDVGRVRDGNEDAFLNEAPLFAVADGMGGHQGGEVASRLALDTLDGLFRRHRGGLADHVREANRAVYERSARDAAVAGMGTTLTVAVAETDRLRLAHVGDSRAYLLRRGSLRLLTQDHTLVHRMIERGEITEEEAQVHPHRSMLVRSVGTEPNVDVDEVVVDVEDGDRLLLCTDGLTGMVDDDEVKEILSRSQQPRDAVKELVATANRHGGVDNITAVVLDVAIDGEGAGTPESRPSHADESTTGRRHAAGLGGGRATDRRHLARRVIAWTVMIALVVVVALFGLRFYLDQQWYVGAANGRVAIFRGIPSQILGFRLSRAVVVTALPADAVGRLQFYGGLPSGISAENRSAADDIVRQIGEDLRRQQAADQRADRRAQRRAQNDQTGESHGGAQQHGSGHHHARLAA